MAEPSDDIMKLTARVGVLEAAFSALLRALDPTVRQAIANALETLDAPIAEIVAQEPNDERLAAFTRHMNAAAKNLSANLKAPLPPDFEPGPSP